MVSFSRHVEAGRRRDGPVIEALLMSARRGR